MMRQELVAGALIFLLASKGYAQSPQDIPAPLQAVEQQVGVKYSATALYQRGWIEYSLGQLPTGAEIHSFAHIRLCQHISQDFLSTSQTFSAPIGIDFPLRVEIIQKGCMTASCEERVVALTEIACP